MTSALTAEVFFILPISRSKPTNKYHFVFIIAGYVKSIFTSSMKR